MEEWTKYTVNCTPMCFSLDRRVKLFNLSNANPCRRSVTLKQIICHTQQDLNSAKREAELLQSNPNPHLTECISVHQEPRIGGGQYIYLVLSLTPTNLMTEITNRRERFTEVELQQCFLNAATALAHLQRLQVAYQNVRLSNLLLDETGNVRVCDFGVQTETWKLTDGFLSPQVRSELAGQRVGYDLYKSDVFSLGVCMAGLSLLECCPFDGDLSDLEATIRTKLGTLVEIYSQQWIANLSRMLQVTESERPDFLGLMNTVPCEYADDEEVESAIKIDIKSPLTVSIKSGYSHLRVGQQYSDEMPCVITLAAAHLEGENKKLYSVDLICAIDVSGSMDGDRMVLVKRSLKKMLTSMQESDRMCLITFSNEAKRKTPLIACNEAGRQQLRTEIDNMQQEDLTNIVAGLVMALDVARQRRYTSNPASILLFTDGRDNFERNPLDSCQRALQYDPIENLRVHCFGFCDDHDLQLLNSISEQGNGLFYYIPNRDDISKAFGAVFGHICTVVARNIRVTVKTLNEHVPCIISQRYSINLQNEFYLPDIISSTQKDLVFSLKTPFMQLSAPLHIDLVNVRVEFTDYENVSTTIEKSLTMDLVPWVDVPPPENGIVFANFHRVHGATALATAKERATKGNFQEAINIISNAISLISAYRYINEPAMVKFILQDLQEARTILRGPHWNQKEHSKLLMMTYSHMSQTASLANWETLSRPQQAHCLVVNESSLEES